MFQEGDKVYVCATRPGFKTGTGTWGYVSDCYDNYNEDTEEWDVQVVIEVFFYRTKRQKKGKLLRYNDRFYIEFPATSLDYYSNRPRDEQEILNKIKLMSERQSFKFKGV
jgi:hypothetical protein